MVFLDYTRLTPFAFCLVLAATCLWLFRVAGAKAKLVRIPTQIVSGALAAGSILITLMLGCGELFNSTSHLEPLYSPDRKSALRITIVDSGALGGFTHAELFSSKGLHISTVFRGEWKQVDPKHTRWNGNDQLVIQYDSDFRRTPMCNDAQGVTVLCTPVPYFQPGSPKK